MSQFLCVGRVTGLTRQPQHWISTNSAKHASLAQPPQDLLLLGSDIVIANGDKLGIDEFAIHCDHNQQLWVVQLEEILVKARNSPQVWVVLVQIYQAQGLVAPYQMPKLVSSGYHAVVTAAVSIIHQ